jgi:hypothetical protein
LHGGWEGCPQPADVVTTPATCSPTCPSLSLVPKINLHHWFPKLICTTGFHARVECSPSLPRQLLFEYIKKTLRDWLREKGIQHTFTTFYMLEHNETAEKKNQDLMASIRSMLAYVYHFLFGGRLFSILFVLPIAPPPGLLTKGKCCIIFSTRGSHLLQTFTSLGAVH